MNAFLQAKIEAAEQPFEVAGKKYRAGTFVIRNAGVSPATQPSEPTRSDFNSAAKTLGLEIQSTDSPITVKTHPLATPRIALVHSWQSTQNDGWFRIPVDEMKIPYTYIADAKFRDTADLRSQFDVII